MSRVLERNHFCLQPRAKTRTFTFKSVLMIQNSILLLQIAPCMMTTMNVYDKIQIPSNKTMFINIGSLLLATVAIAAAAATTAEDAAGVTNFIIRAFAKPTKRPTRRPSTGRPSAGRPSAGRPSTGRPSTGRPTSEQPTMNPTNTVSFAHY